MLFFLYNQDHYYEEQERKYNILKKELSQLYNKSVDSKTINPIKIEDDDTSYNIDFIHITSNLRAQNFQIAEVRIIILKKYYSAKDIKQRK